jgi:hypothetical protein
MSPPVAPVVLGVTLELSHDEAQYIRDLTGAVGGTGPARRLNDAVYEALKKAGYTYETRKHKFDQDAHVHDEMPSLFT